MTKTRAFAELLIDCEEERVLRARARRDAAGGQSLGAAEGRPWLTPCGCRTCSWLRSRGQENEPWILA
jgi:hypothetical protein